MPMLPEEKARVKIDKQLRNAGWDIVARNEYLPNSTFSPQAWYGLWFEKLIPLVYMANGNKIYFKNMLEMQRGYLVERLLKWYLLSNGI